VLKRYDGEDAGKGMAVLDILVFEFLLIMCKDKGSGSFVCALVGVGWTTQFLFTS
jgi:hypothetical protein